MKGDATRATSAAIGKRIYFVTPASILSNSLVNILKIYNLFVPSEAGRAVRGVWPSQEMHRRASANVQGVSNGVMRGRRVIAG
jgi:hypothetical protein